ncbi:MAG: sterol desaturase family protein, partial [Polaromonas sp.]|nr:sterol desaturase family protein [Polaromonas sp.]
MLEKLNELTESHGELRPGKGIMSGVIALSLGILCFLGVLAFHFPEYLTTPQLRKSYNVDVIRLVMLAALAIAGGISLVNIIFNRSRWLASAGFLLVVATALLGGHKVPVNDFADNTPYIGLDWFILDLLGSSLIFIF